VEKSLEGEKEGNGVSYSFSRIILMQGAMDSLHLFLLHKADIPVVNYLK
jgi:hypothetical protein